MAKPATLHRDISPPPKGQTFLKAKKTLSATVTKSRTNDDPSMAAVEAGKVQIDDHLEYFAKQLTSVLRGPEPGLRWLGIENYKLLFLQNQHRHGRHFVVHQHDHPVSGVHYDLRLQFSLSSTVSFAIPYGLPGNPKSVRPNRMAIETRVHCLWNNLIESASHATGSLLIWDVGEYEILPWKQSAMPMTDDENSEGEVCATTTACTHSEKLFAAFQDRHIKLRLRGTRLPRNYTIGLRLPSKNDRNGQRKRPRVKRRRLDPSVATHQSSTLSTDSDEDDIASAPRTVDENNNNSSDVDNAGIASDNEDEDTIRENNAYPGAINSIGSVHQRHWFLTLDRRQSGFKKAKNGEWIGSWEPFFVRGRDHERSVVTRRNADEVMEDEGVEKFVGRKMWRPILE
jgi:hypothetical protein